jgi:hypothetical protein
MKIIFKIDKIEGERAILSDAEGKKTAWPIDKLPANAKENDQITFAIGEEDALAKNILNEILGQ